MGQQTDTPNPGCSDHLRTSPLTSFPPKLLRSSAWDCSPLPPRPHPCPATQGLTHSREELEREDSQKQEQELVHLGLGRRGTQRGRSREQRAQEGLGQAALARRGDKPGDLGSAAPGLWAEASFYTLVSGCFTATGAQEMFPRNDTLPPPYF